MDPALPGASPADMQRFSSAVLQQSPAAQCCMLSPKVHGTHVRCVCGNGRPSVGGSSRDSVHTGQAEMDLTSPSCACVCAQPDDETPAPTDPACQTSPGSPAAEPFPAPL